MFTFPIVGQKIQLPEIFFLLLAPFILRYYRALVHHIQFLGPAIFLLLLPSLVHLSSCFLYPTQAAFLELGGSVYLALLALIFSWWFTVEHRPIHNLATISSVAIFLSFAISILSIISIWVPIGHGIDLVFPKQFPVLGIIHRGEGFSITPNMQASILLVFLCLFLSTTTNNRSHQKWLFFSLGAFSLILTGSKVLITAFFSFLIACSTWLVSRLGWPPNLFRILGIAGIILYMSFLHLPCMTDGQYQQLESAAYLQGNQTYRPFSGVTCRASTYTLLKEKAVGFFLTHPVSGIGSGQFTKGIRQQQHIGAYPASAPVYAPHSIYFGILAENGLIGAFLLLIWIILWMRTMTRVSFHRDQHPILDALRLILLFFLLEGMAMDVMNHRGLWVVAGITIGVIMYGSETADPVEPGKKTFTGTIDPGHPSKLSFHKDR